MSVRIVIVEDEIPASDRLIRLLKKNDEKVEIYKTLDSVASAVAYFKEESEYDLIFMDIQLGDGLSLEIFDHVEIKKPVIFVTAYDDYTLKAFKVNSIDYLLKPIDFDDLNKAMDQFYSLKEEFSGVTEEAHNLLNTLDVDRKKERFLVKKGSGLRIISIDQVAYFYSEDGYVHIMDKEGSKHIIDTTLDKLFTELDSEKFFKINRKMIVSIPAISKIDSYFNSRLVLQMVPPAPHQVIVSREKCKAFKNWLA